jgi:drug/metabolite transporter superfamily protein YnfA
LANCNLGEIMRTHWHEIYLRKRQKNLWLGLIMVSLVVLIFLVTLVKLASGNKMQAFDHTIRTELISEGEQSE